MAVSEKITDPVSSCLDEWDSAAFTLGYAWNVMGQAGNLSLDVARSVLVSYSKLTSKEKCSGRRRQIGGYIQCPRCSTPWIAGFCQPRLIGFPRSVRNIKYLLKKEKKHPNKLRSLEKNKLSSFHLRQNVIEMSCLICKHKMREHFPAPVKEKIIVKTKPGVTKRKKLKEVNAGLQLSSIRMHGNPANLGKSTPISDNCVTSVQEKNFIIYSSEDNLKVRNEVCDTSVKSKFREKESLNLFRTFEETLPERVTKSTASLSLSNSTAGSRPGSRPGYLHAREIREKQKQLSRLKNAAFKDISRHSNNDNIPLNDFLDSLF